MRHTLLVLATAAVMLAVFAATSFASCSSCGFPGTPSYSAAPSVCTPCGQVAVAPPPPPACTTCAAPAPVCSTCPAPAPACNTCAPAPALKWSASLTNAQTGACTTANGNADFQLNREGNAVRYWLNVGCIQNVASAQVRLLGPDCNPATAQVVATLYNGPVRTVAANGRIARGNITACELTGPLTGQPVSMLVAALNNGTAFVTVDSQQCAGGPCLAQIAGRVAPIC